jgi:hypothetical protein
MKVNGIQSVNGSASISSRPHSRSRRDRITHLVWHLGLRPTQIPTARHLRDARCRANLQAILVATLMDMSIEQLLAYERHVDVPTRSTIWLWAETINAALIALGHGYQLTMDGAQVIARPVLTSRPIVLVYSMEHILMLFPNNHLHIGAPDEAACLTGTSRMFI